VWITGGIMLTGGKLKYLEKSIVPLPFVHYKFHTVESLNGHAGL